MHDGDSACRSACGARPWQAMHLASVTLCHGSWHIAQLFAIGFPLASRAWMCAEDTVPGIRRLWRSGRNASLMANNTTISSNDATASFVRYGRRRR